MTKRKSKKPQEEDTSILLEPTVSPAKSKTSSHTSSALLFIVVFTIGASMMGWFCAQQQQSLDQLSETFTAMQKRIANLQQVVMTDAQTDTGVSVEERMFALEEAQKQAQEKAEVALATSEKLKNSDNYLQLWALHDEMDTRLTKIKQAALSVTTLQALFNNQSVEFEAVKESVVAGLSSISALAENVAGLTSALLSAGSRVDYQVASVEALHAQLEGQASDLNELKESMYLHKDALHANNQEMAAIKELVEAKQVMRAQALEEMLSSVQMTLDEQYFTSQTLRSSLMTQLQTFHSQLANVPSRSMKATSNEEGPAAEEFVSTPQNAAEEKIEDVDEQQDTDDEAEEKAEEEEAMQEEQPLEQEVEAGVIEEQGEEEEDITQEDVEDITPEEDEDITPEEEEDEDNTEQSEEQAVAGEEAAEEEVAEETVDDHVLDESLEEEVSEEVEETVVEDSGELNREVFMDGNYEDV